MDWRARMGRLARRLILVLAVLAIGFFAGVGVSVMMSRAGMGTETSQTQATDGTGHSQTESPQDSSAPYVAPVVSHTAWDESESPNYYRVIGSAKVGTMPAPGTVRYGELDELGRATGAVAQVTYESMEEGRARERDNTSAIEPSGWGHNAEVDIAMPDGTVYHGLLFNRSHLIAKSLGGHEDVRNLITATRTQNVGANVNGSEGGMAYAEGIARSWLSRHEDGSLYYAATPAYDGNELVARSVIVDIYSDDGSVDQRIEVYNAARGFEIDYATGTFEATEDAQAAAAEIREEASGQQQTTVAPVTPTGTPESENGERKVIITGSGEAYHHDETCSGLANARSMEWVTVSEAENRGRHPCGICGG